MVFSFWKSGSGSLVGRKQTGGGDFQSAPTRRDPAATIGTLVSPPPGIRKNMQFPLLPLAEWRQKSTVSPPSPTSGQPPPQRRNQIPLGLLAHVREPKVRKGGPVFGSDVCAHGLQFSLRAFGERELVNFRLRALGESGAGIPKVLKIPRANHGRPETCGFQKLFPKFDERLPRPKFRKDMQHEPEGPPRTHARARRCVPREEFPGIGAASLQTMGAHL
jgi:hypothetical protein